jgi:hypothetical protein
MLSLKLWSFPLLPYPYHCKEVLVVFGWQYRVLAGRHTACEKTETPNPVALHRLPLAMHSEQGNT